MVEAAIRQLGAQQFMADLSVKPTESHNSGVEAGGGKGREEGMLWGQKLSLLSAAVSPDPGIWKEVKGAACFIWDSRQLF